MMPVVNGQFIGRWIYKLNLFNLSGIQLDEKQGRNACRQWKTYQAISSQGSSFLEGGWGGFFLLPSGAGEEADCDGS